MQRALARGLRISLNNPVAAAAPQAPGIHVESIQHQHVRTQKSLSIGRCQILQIGNVYPFEITPAP
jgi:hypothetical protein